MTSAETPYPCTDKTAKTGSVSFGGEGAEHSENLALLIEMESRSTPQANNALDVAVVARRHGLTVDELCELAADDWQHVQADAVLADAFLTARAERLDREAGRAPEAWTEEARCSLCGPVWLPPGLSREPLTCPWCHVRHAGGAVPCPPERVAMVMCRKCSHYAPNSPYALTGHCRNEVVVMTNRGTYGTQKRSCEGWRAAP